MDKGDKFYVAFWVRVRDKVKGIRNIIRVLGSGVYNPFGIPDLERRINEDEGTLEFVINGGNLFDDKLDYVVVFDLPVGDSRLILQREAFYYLVFYRISPRYGLRITKLDVSRMKGSKGLDIFVVWSPREDKLYVGDLEHKVGLLSAGSKDMITKLIRSRDGSYILVGGEGVDVRMVYIKIGERVVSEPSAIELFNFNTERIRVLLEGCNGDFLFETSCIQAGIVLLVSALEAYFKKRFIELEKEGLEPNIEELLKKIFSPKNLESNMNEIIERARSGDKSAIEILAERYINFQNLDECKKAFAACYKLKLGEIFEKKPYLIEKVRKIISYRHKIVHSGRDVTIINYDEVPAKTPVFSNRQLLEEALQDIIEFVNLFHEVTLHRTIR
jgi:hypothetical protein